MSQTVRAFIAVKVPATPPLRKVLARLGGMGRAVRAVDPDHLHVTLKFLGDTPLEQTAAISRVLRQAAESKPAFELRLAGTGAFPHAQRPTVVWAGLEQTEMLVQIAQELERGLKPLGFPPEHRQFRPHLTLARIKSRPPDELHELLEEHADTAFGTAAVGSVELFQSELLREGPRYTVLASVPLAGQA